ncbi:hypothetical protein GQ53DRAFT_96237 [Thozetella sp. PMI_491]|nr:hypothetical protein GQ53DRAFT_96237 [Thozetella sp. PMI_491]
MVSRRASTPATACESREPHLDLPELAIEMSFRGNQGPAPGAIQLSRVPRAGRPEEGGSKNAVRFRVSSRGSGKSTSEGSACCVRVLQLLAAGCTHSKSLARTVRRPGRTLSQNFGELWEFQRMPRRWDGIKPRCPLGGVSLAAIAGSGLSLWTRPRVGWWCLLQVDVGNVRVVRVRVLTTR